MTPLSTSEGEAWIRTVYRAHGDELYGFALRSLADDRLAEEVVQDTFLKAWRARRRFDRELGSLRTWLFAICRNVVIDAARARRVRPLADGDPNAVTELGVADGVDSALTAWQVEEALRRLSADHREALVEIHLRGRPYREVAAELGIPPGTLKSRVYYGLRALELTLEEMGWPADG